jgi:hypothetical protein
MIIATVAALMILFGGGAFSFEKAYEPFINDVIADEARAGQAIQLTKEADKNVRQFKKEVGEVWSKDLKVLVSDYHTTDEQFLAFYEKAAASRTAMQQQMLDIRFRLTSIMTKDEWDALYRRMDEKAAENRKKAEEKK